MLTKLIECNLIIQLINCFQLLLKSIKWRKPTFSFDAEITHMNLNPVYNEYSITKQNKVLFIAGLELPSRINKDGVTRILEDFFIEYFGLPEVSIHILKFFTACLNKRSVIYARVDKDVFEHVVRSKHICLRNSSITVDRFRSKAYLTRKRRLKALQHSGASNEGLQEVVVPQPPPSVPPPAATQLSPSVGDSFDDGNAGSPSASPSPTTTYDVPAVSSPPPSPEDPNKLYPVEAVVDERWVVVDGKKVREFHYKYVGYEKLQWHPASFANLALRREWNRQKAAKKAAEEFLQQLQQEQNQVSQQESSAQETPQPRNLRRSNRLKSQTNGEQIISA